MSPEEIVRRLADEAPTVHMDTWHWCGLCQGALGDHEEDCLYVAARCWVDSQDAP